MKKLVNVLSAVVLALLIGVSMSFTPAPGGDDNNGVTVEVIKNGSWVLLSSCGNVPSTSSTEQYKNGVLHMRTTFYQLPDGCSEIPSSTVKGGDASYNWQYTPSGKVIYRQKFN